MAQVGALEGAVALVTGAARGIGRGCALELARAGADVAVVDLQHEDEAAQSAYNLAKAGVVHLMRTAAVELAAHRINVNAIAPGWIDTPGERQHATEAELAAAARELPWGRLGRPEKMGRLAVFLAGPDADFISGSLVRADAGELVSLRA